MGIADMQANILEQGRIQGREDAPSHQLKIVCVFVCVYVRVCVCVCVCVSKVNKIPSRLSSQAVQMSSTQPCTNSATGNVVEEVLHLCTRLHTSCMWCRRMESSTSCYNGTHISSCSQEFSTAVSPLPGIAKRIFYYFRRGTVILLSILSYAFPISLRL